MLRHMRRAWPVARATVYKEDKGPGVHLRNQLWRLYWDVYDWDCAEGNVQSAKCRCDARDPPGITRAELAGVAT